MSRIGNIIEFFSFNSKKGTTKKRPLHEDDTFRLYNTATGKYFIPKSAKDDIIAQAILSDQIFDENIINIAKQYIKPDSVVLDVGANYGQMSMLFSKMVGNNGLVYSFEANKFIYDILDKNIKVNQIHNIIPIYGAVYNKSNVELNFPDPDLKRFGTYGSYGIDFLNKSVVKKSVPTVAIDDLNISKNISLIKVDVQGGDLFVLEGAVNTIAKHKMPIIFEFEYQFQDELDLDFQMYVDFVKDIKYKFARVIDGYNFLIKPY